MRFSGWSSDVCSSDLVDALQALLDGAIPRLDVSEDEAHEIAQRLGVSLVMSTASCGAARGTHMPMPTLMTGANPHFASPIMLCCNSKSAPRPVSQPAPTITTGGASSPVRPGNDRPRSIGRAHVCTPVNKAPLV